MSRVCVVGASSVLGARLLVKLQKSGHIVNGVTFKPASAVLLQRLGAESHVIDVLEKGTLFRALEGADAVINCTPSYPLDPARSRFTDSVCSAGMRNISEVAATLGVRALINTSFVWAGQPHDDAPFDEDSAPPQPPLLPIALGEQGAVAAVSRAGDRMRHRVLRFGHLYSGDSELWQLMASNLHARNLPIIGKGHNVRPVIHTDDAAAAVALVLDDMLRSEYPVTSVNNSKVFHVVDDAGVTAHHMLTSLAAAIGAPPPKTVSLFMAKMMGPDSAQLRLLTSSCVTSNALFRRHYPEFVLQYPTWDAGLSHMRTWWRAFPQTRVLIKS